MTALEELRALRDEDREVKKQYDRDRANKSYHNRKEMLAARRNNKELTARANEIRTDNKKRLVELRGNRCGDCKNKYPYYVYDFHHLDPKDKKSVVRFELKWERILEEAEKCVMLCANCHRILHHNKRIAA